MGTGLLDSVVPAKPACVEHSRGLAQMRFLGVTPPVGAQAIDELRAEPVGLHMPARLLIQHELT